MKRLMAGLVACLLVFLISFPAVTEEDDLTARETKAVDQWYQQATKKKLTAGKGQPLWAGKAVFACWYEPYDRFLLSSDYVRRLKDFYGLPSYSSLLADSLENADLLVIINAKYTKTGTYTDRTSAYQTDTLAYVIELKEKRLFGPYTMASNEAPHVVREGESRSGEFEPETAVKKLSEKWIDEPRDERSEETYREAQALDKAGNYYQARDKYMESRWNDWRAKVASCQKTMPKTGVLWRNQAVKGTQATLTLQVKGAPKNYGYLARIYQEDGTAAAYLFIRGNAKATVKLPAGKYTVSVGMGDKWFGEKDAFGDDYEGDYYACEFNESKTLALTAKKTVTVQMTVYAAESYTDTDGEYWVTKGKKYDVSTDFMDWKDFRR